MKWGGWGLQCNVYFAVAGGLADGTQTTRINMQRRKGQQSSSEKEV